MMNDSKKILLEEKRIENMNNRVEATQTINPITGLEYLNFDYPKVGKFEDPIQAHLRAMEERNPSTSEHKQGLLKTLIDRLSFINRGLQYKKSDEIEIFKVGRKDKKEIYIYDLMPHNLEILSDHIFKEYKDTSHENLNYILKLPYKDFPYKDLLQ